MKVTGHEVVADTPRPFRLYNATLKKFLLYYIYNDLLRATRSGFWLCKWMPVDTVIEVVDVRTMGVRATYVRRVNHIEVQSETKLKSGLHIRLKGEKNAEA